jgi:hypothetical protein
MKKKVSLTEHAGSDCERGRIDAETSGLLDRAILVLLGLAR